MAALAAMHPNKTGPFQIADELADFTRHMGKNATNAPELPVLLFLALKAQFGVVAKTSGKAMVMK